MHITSLLRALALVACTNLPAAAADISHCRGIADDTARLTCFDTAAAGIDRILGEQVVAPADSQAAGDDMYLSSPMSRRLAKEEAMMNNPFVIIPHGRNYVLAVTYNSKANEDTWTDIFQDAGMDDVEAKFQISFKVRLLENLIGNGDLWAAYTQQSWWQVYNDNESSPFRETNYEPEVMMVWDNDWKIAGLTNTKLSFGLNHQSNGRGDLLSRSWNRIMAGALFEKENFTARLRVWHRIHETDNSDDNPSMEKYYGYGDLRLAYQWDQQEFSALIRNNTRFDGANKGALQLEWTMPVNNRFRWYLQYFYGYGESLIDYNVKTSRVGIGFTMNNLF